MPRRKGTRLGAKQAKPTLKSVDLDTSLTEEERKNKLEVFIADFKLEVENRKIAMTKEATTLVSKIANQYNVELLKLPLSMRNLPLKEVFATGGDPCSVTFQQNNNNFFRKPLSAVDNKIEPQTPDTDHHKMEAPTTTSRTLRSRKNQKQTNPVPTRSTRKKQLPNSCVTPAVSSINTFATPAITPKFDPRLPFTPALLRNPRKGERIMSLAGSPLTNRNGTESNAIEMLIPSGSGETLHITSNSGMSPSTITGLDNVAKQNLYLLQQKLATLLKAVS